MELFPYRGNDFLPHHTLILWMYNPRTSRGRFENHLSNQRKSEEKRVREKGWNRHPGTELARKKKIQLTRRETEARTRRSEMKIRSSDNLSGQLKTLLRWKKSTFLEVSWKEGPQSRKTFSMGPHEAGHTPVLGSWRKTAPTLDGSMKKLAMSPKNGDQWYGLAGKRGLEMTCEMAGWTGTCNPSTPQQFLTQNGRWIRTRPVQLYERRPICRNAD